MFAYIDGPFPYHTVLCFSVLFGFLGGLLYECFRVLRSAVAISVKPKGKVLAVANKIGLFLEDLFYFFVLSVAAVLFLFVFNRGQLRISMMACMGLGFVLYYVSLGKLLLSMHRALLGLLFRILKWIYCHTLRYLFAFLAYLARITLGRVYLRVKTVAIGLWKRYLIYRAKRKLSDLVRAAENGFKDLSDHISIN